MSIFFFEVRINTCSCRSSFCIVASGHLSNDRFLFPKIPNDLCVDRVHTKPHKQCDDSSHLYHKIIINKLVNLKILIHGRGVAGTRKVARQIDEGSRQVPSPDSPFVAPLMLQICRLYFLLLL